MGFPHEALTHMFLLLVHLAPQPRRTVTKEVRGHASQYGIPRLEIQGRGNHCLCEFPLETHIWTVVIAAHTGWGEWWAC